MAFYRIIVLPYILLLYFSSGMLTAYFERMLFQSLLKIEKFDVCLLLIFCSMKVMSERLRSIEHVFHDHKNEFNSR